MCGVCLMNWSDFWWYGVGGVLMILSFWAVARAFLCGDIAC